MKRYLILFLILIGYAILYCAAEITFFETSHDFGEIEEENGQYEHKFVFTNTGNEPFKLTKVKAG
jgi:Protein of unknown function (DUF1573)